MFKLFALGTSSFAFRHSTFLKRGTAHVYTRIILSYLKRRAAAEAGDDLFPLVAVEHPPYELGRDEGEIADQHRQAEGNHTQEERNAAVGAHGQG